MTTPTVDADSTIERPLQAAVDNYLRGGPPAGGAPLRLHVPGHQGGAGAPPALQSRWGLGLLQDDLTELPGLDDLHAPQGAIRASQAVTAAGLGAAHAFYLVQGTTGGLVALLMALACIRPERRAFILPRYSHRAMVAAAVMAGLEPVFCRTIFTEQGALGMDIVHLEALLSERATECVAVCDQYPNAAGISGDLAAVSRAAHGHGLPLVVDGAHAALYGLHPDLPAAPLALGADAVAISAHKTLGSLGQSSLLLLGDSPWSPEPRAVAAALRLVTTTSPSYPLLLSLEAAVAHRMSAAGRSQLATAVAAAGWLRQALAGLGLAVIDAPAGWAQDPLRISLAARPLAPDGPALADLLRERAGVQVEGADWRSVLMVIGPGDSKQSLQPLVDGVAEIRGGRLGAVGVSAEYSVLPAARLTALSEAAFAIPDERCCGVRQAWFGQRELVALAEASGRIAAEALAPYPPGVPVVWPGERLEPAVLELLSMVLCAGGSVHGLEMVQGLGHSCQVLCIPERGRAQSCL